MAIIEFTGMPRSGKTTTARSLEDIEGVTIYPERFDLVPEELRQDPYQYNLWYAKYCVDRLLECLEKPGIHIFERGVVDRLIHGKSNVALGRFTEEQYKEYEEVLLPYVGKNDLTLVFNISAEESRNRATQVGKNVTTAMPYLESLNREYSKIKEWVPEAIYLPEKATLDELATLVKKHINDLIYKS